MKGEGKNPSASKGRVLVMDDAEIVRKVTGRMLGSNGYEVSFAGDGAEALELYKESIKSGQKFDVVILDLTVPGGMGGRKTIKKLLEIDPNARAIVSSGYFNDPIVSDFKKHGFRAALLKPYDMNELERVVVGVLDQE